MFETHGQIIKQLDATGLKEFSAERIKEIIHQVELEEADKMLDYHFPEDVGTGCTTQPVSWEEAAEGLGEIHQSESSRETEMER